MKNLMLIGALVLGLNTAKANVEEIPCISFQEAINASLHLPYISESELPKLQAGWKWVTVYRPSRDGSDLDPRWMSWVDGETLTLCQ